MIAVLITILSILLDRITKSLARTFLKPFDTVPIARGVLHFTYVENHGASFGMLADHRWVFMSVSVLAIAAIIGYLIYSRGRRSALLTAALSLILAGGIGNMIDRLTYGAVVDFIDFRLINFYVFNLADAEISIGAALFILYLFIEPKKQTEKKGDEHVG